MGRMLSGLLVADGFAMAAGSYSGTQAERDDYNRLLAVERKHIAAVPDGEREEIRQMFGGKGFSGDNLEAIVDVITADESRWAKTMVVEEYGLAPTAHTRNGHSAGSGRTFVHWT
jgi:hypothetical protein